MAEPLADSGVLGTLPMRFEAGQGHYVARGAGYAVAVGDRAATLAVGDRALRLTFPGSTRAVLSGEEKSAAPTTYFHASERRAADAFARVRQTGVYPGIDVVFYGTGGNVEYDFELAPGADPSAIAMRFEGAEHSALNAKGDLVLSAGGQEITQKLPVVYQRRGNEVTGVPASYRLDSEGVVRLALAEYDASRQLIVDPSIVLTGYLPGTGAEGVVGVARDARGFLYLAGYTFSTDFALVGDSYNLFLRNSLREGFVTKINPEASGNDLIVYSTFIGSSATDDPKAVTVDRNGLVYLTGITDSFDYPTTDGAYVKTFGGGSRRIFVSVLDTTDGPNGLRYSTYFGGTKTDEPTAIAVANGLVYITGFTTSDDFPVGGAWSATRVGSYDAFISVFDPAQSGNESLRYSSYFGGTGQDISRTIAVGPDNTVYIAGGTYSGDFPTTLGAYQDFYAGVGDAFLTRIDLGDNSLKYSTYLGGVDNEQVRKIILQPDGRVAMTGYTFSYNFPITQNALQPVFAGNADVFFTVLNPAAADASALVYGTFLGGVDGEVAYDMRRDAQGRYYLCGYTVSKDFPIRNALQPVSANGGSDAFVAILNPAAQPNAALQYSSFITGPGAQIAYGIDVDAEGLVVVTGITTGVLFEQGQAQPAIPSSTNVFILFFRP